MRPRSQRTTRPEPTYDAPEPEPTYEAPVTTENQAAPPVANHSRSAARAEVGDDDGADPRAGDNGAEGPDDHPVAGDHHAGSDHLDGGAHHVEEAHHVIQWTDYVVWADHHVFLCRAHNVVGSCRGQHARGHSAQQGDAHPAHPEGRQPAGGDSTGRVLEHPR